MKRLIVMADGTWNKPGQQHAGRYTPTNVVKLATSVQPVDAAGVAQVVYYHEGVGENGGLWDHLSGGAFGLGLSRNIQELYRFLCINYAAGDELWLFGFSRGAYSARSLAGLVRNCGLLRREHLSRVGEAYALYRERGVDSHPGAPRASDFRAAYSWPDFAVHFIGVWDTVGALGIPVTPLRFWAKKRYEFHDVQLSRHVRHAYHALALDERRKPFAPTLWQRQPGSPVEQVLEQAWFVGSHSNVGGGLPDSGISDCALRWMWDRAARAGLALDAAREPVGDPEGETSDSMNLFYRLLGDGQRMPGQQAHGAEGLHRSVSQRSGYLPGRLQPFLATDPPDYAP